MRRCAFRDLLTIQMLSESHPIKLGATKRGVFPTLLFVNYSVMAGVVNGRLSIVRHSPENNVSDP